jgi:hypothetical protein
MTPSLRYMAQSQRRGLLLAKRAKQTLTFSLLFLRFLASALTPIQPTAAFTLLSNPTSRRIASYTGASFPSLAPIPCRNTPIQASETISNCPLLEREAVELSGAPHLTRAFPPPDLNTCHSPSSHFLHPFATPLSPTLSVASVFHRHDSWAVFCRSE